MQRLTILTTGIILMKIGKVIRMLRARRGLTLAALSELAGISHSYLSLLEAGKRQPTLETLDRLATALSVPTAGLIVLATPKSKLDTVAPASGAAKLYEALMLLLEELDHTDDYVSEQTDQVS